MWQTLKEAIDNAMPDPVELYDWLHTADEIVEAVGPVLAAVAAGGAGMGRFLYHSCGAIPQAANRRLAIGASCGYRMLRGAEDSCYMMT